MNGLRLLCFLLWLVPGLLPAAERLEVCFNYGCNQRVPVLFTDDKLERLGTKFADVPNAQTERALIARAVARLYRIAGRQTPIFVDRAGNLRDGGAYGRMDCIDHSATTTAFLELMAGREWLRFHQVREPARRSRFIFRHYSAAIEQLPTGARESEAPMRFVVDSWFVDHGEPAVILPLDDWLKGEGPNVH